MKRLVCLFVLLAGCGGAPKPKPAPPAAPTPTAEAEPEGIPVVTVPSESPIVELRMVFQAGSAFDPEDKEGAAWLLGHLLAEGGTESLPYTELLKTLHPWAAQIQVQVDREMLTLIARVHRDHLEEFYPIFRDVLLAPRMDQSDFERLQQKAITLLTREIRPSNDEELSKLVLERVLFMGHPYGHPPVGTEAALEAMTLDDLKRHRDQVLTQSRLTIGLAGAVDDALVEKVKADMAKLPKGEAAPEMPPSPPDQHRLVVVEQPNAKATAISIGHTLPVTRGDEDFPALALTASWFGEHRMFHGRLFQEIREARGMNYGDYAYAEAFVQEGWSRLPLTNIARSRQHFSMWIRPVPTEDRHFAVRIAMHLLRALVDEGLTADDVAKTREFLSGYLYLLQQTDQRRLGYAIDDHFYGLETPYGDWLRSAWAEMTAEEVNAAIREHIHPDLVTIVVVTPDADAFVEAVLQETPSPKEYASPKPAEVTRADAVIAKEPLGFRGLEVTVVPAARLFER